VADKRKQAPPADIVMTFRDHLECKTWSSQRILDEDLLSNHNKLVAYTLKSCQGSFCIVITNKDFRAMELGAHLDQQVNDECRQVAAVLFKRFPQLRIL
jgi:hypothetical protein